MGDAQSRDVPGTKEDEEYGALAGLLRPGNAGSHIAADHETVLASASPSSAIEWPKGFWCNTDAAGATPEFPTHLAARRQYRPEASPYVRLPVVDAVCNADQSTQALSAVGPVRTGPSPR